MHKISYVVPETVLNKQTNLAVADLLQQCKNLKGPDNNKSDKMIIEFNRKGLIDPFGNSGMNSEFIDGFKHIQFTITNDPKQKKEESFSIIPKYIQV